MYLRFCYNLNEIVSPTENSFIKLLGISFPDTRIQSIPENLFANCPNVIYFNNTFEGCSITSIPENLFDNCKEVELFFKTFFYCEKITGNAPELWTRGTNSEENNYEGNPDGFNCFAGCEGLENYDVIPHYWKNMAE